MPSSGARLAAALADRYRLERELGQGGMATVYLAHDLKHDRKVAVKVLRPEVSAALGPERFLREIRIAAQLSHPNILPLHDSGEVAASAEEGRLLYYVMPFVDGESLRSRLERGGPLPVGETTRLVRDIVDALAKAHRAGVIHRDIKPENILLSDGHALVADFGVARAVSAAASSGDHTTAGMALGTPAYMAPEQAAGDPNIDHRADLYAVGLVAYEMLTGHQAFAGPTPQALIAAQITARPAPVATRRAGIPASLAALVMRCLEKNPADRWSSSEELLQALDSPDSGTRPTPWRWIAAIIFVLIVASGALLFTHRKVGPGSAPSRPVPSIAVLPFVNMSGDSANEYFSDGITEEILNSLSQLPLLQVAARTSSFQFKGKDVDLREVGRQLGVSTLLEGSVQHMGESVRITAQLIDARSGYHLWSGKYDRRLENIFAVEDEIARAIADTLRISLGLTEHARLDSSATVDPVAHELYLKGLSLMSQRGAALGRATQYLESALVRDSTLAPAAAALAQAYELLPYYYLSPWDSALANAEAAARRALRFDSLQPTAHSVLGSIHRDRWEWRQADMEYRRALALAPNDPETIDQYAQFLGAVGEMDSALVWIERASRLDPLAPVPIAGVGVVFMTLKEPDSSVAMLNRAVGMAPALAIARFWSMWSHLAARSFPEAEAAARRGAELIGTSPDPYLTLINGARDPSARAAALALLGRLPDNAPQELGIDSRANWYALLGDSTSVFRSLDRWAETKRGNPVALWYPFLDPYRSSPRFVTALHRFGFPFHSTIY
ncbi:MAG: protein kinase [Gemmatimonadota bacterium]